MMKLPPNCSMCENNSYTPTLTTLPHFIGQEKAPALLLLAVDPTSYAFMPYINATIDMPHAAAIYWASSMSLPTKPCTCGTFLTPNFLPTLILSTESLLATLVPNTTTAFSHDLSAVQAVVCARVFPSLAQAADTHWVLWMDFCKERSPGSKAHLH